MGLLNPIGLAFGVLLAVLVALYLLERLRRRVDVPSLLLWQTLREDPLERRRFRPDWLFVLQALLLSALVLGLSRPYLEGAPVPDAGSRHILVLDVSASMQAVENERTRLDEARAAAVHLLQEMDDSDQAMLITAGSRPRVHTGLTGDRIALLRAIGALQAVDTGTNLPAAVALALRASERDSHRSEVVVFTDLPLSALDPAVRQRIRHVRVGETSDNLAVTSLQIFQGSFDEPAAARAYAVVQNFSYAERHGSLSIAVGAEVILHTGFTLPGRASRSFTARGFPRGGLVTATIEVNDALAADNRAYAWLRERRAVSVVFVSSSSPLVQELQHIDGAIAGLAFRHVVPESYEPSSEAAVTIFHRIAPDTAGASALYVYPPAENDLFPVVRRVNDVDVIHWNDRHPVLRGIQPLLAAPLRAAAVIRPPADAVPLLWARAGDEEFLLAFALTRGGRRIACLAFDLEAERLQSNENIPLLLFFLNLIDWLAYGDVGGPPVLATGSTHGLDSPPPGTAIQVVDPRGARKVLPDGEREIDVDVAGVYEISAAEWREVVLANLFDAAESDIGRGARMESAPRSPARFPRWRHVSTELSWWLYLSAAVLMLLEWTIWRVRA